MIKDMKRKIMAGEEVIWYNPNIVPFEKCRNNLAFSVEDVMNASKRLQRFAPVIKYYFSETETNNGIIESPLAEISKMKQYLAEQYDLTPSGRLFLKMDSHLPVSGSVKARGGIYEVLKHTEDLALEAGILTDYDDNFLKLTEDKSRAFFSGYTIQVGSTGNLGMSIGIISAALGYEVIVHMSADAKQWKKDLLREKGAKVVEYEGDYALAVIKGRESSLSNPKSYFVDDENSRDLFCGYAVAGERLAKQLEEKCIKVDEFHPLCVYIPCGVGGAPGGITFGLKLMFGDNVHVFFAEPTQSPCMLVGLIDGLKSKVCVQDYGLTGITEADGLAVGRCSQLVADTIDTLIDGIATVSDTQLHQFIRHLWKTEKIFVEPSSGAAFEPYIKNMNNHQNATHIIWATGGNMMPLALKKEILA